MPFRPVCNAYVITCWRGIRVQWKQCKYMVTAVWKPYFSIGGRVAVGALCATHRTHPLRVDPPTPTPSQDLWPKIS